MFNLRLLRGSLCDKIETKYLAQRILREGGHETDHLQQAYEFGKHIYETEKSGNK